MQRCVLPASWLGRRGGAAALLVLSLPGQWRWHEDALRVLIALSPRGVSSGERVTSTARARCLTKEKAIVVLVRLWFVSSSWSGVGLHWAVVEGVGRLAFSSKLLVRHHSFHERTISRVSGPLQLRHNFTKVVMLLNSDVSPMKQHGASSVVTRATDLTSEENVNNKSADEPCRASIARS
jgi:hypothetical protein